MNNKMTVTIYKNNEVIEIITNAEIVSSPNHLIDKEHKNYYLLVKGSRIIDGELELFSNIYHSNDYDRYSITTI